MRLGIERGRLIFDGPIVGAYRDASGGARWVAPLEALGDVLRGPTLTPTTTLASGLATAQAAIQGALAHADPRLYPYQRDGAVWLSHRTAAVLADEMGLGKTAITLTAIGDAPALVVCPGYLRAVWAAEASTWRPDRKVTVIRTSAKYRPPRAGEIVIVSYGMLPKDPDALDAFEPGTVLVADEAHAIKSYKAQRTRNFRKLSRRAFRSSGKVWLLTGTPILNRPNELWALLQALELGKECYGKHDRFVTLFGGVKDGLGTITWNPRGVKPHALDPARPYILRRERNVVLSGLASKRYETRTVDLTTAARRQLDRFDASDDAIDAAVAGIISPDLNMARREIAELKIPTLLDLIADYEESGTPVVVFSAHRLPIETLRARPGWGAIMGGVSADEREATVQAFQRGDLLGIAGTIGAAGTGITLTRASTVVFVDRAWTPGVNAQAEDRVVRIGQDAALVSIIDLVADHRVDKRVHQLLRAKVITNDKTIATLRDTSDPEIVTHLARALEMLNAV